MACLQTESYFEVYNVYVTLHFKKKKNKKNDKYPIFICIANTKVCLFDIHQKKSKDEKKNNIKIILLTQSQRRNSIKKKRFGGILAFENGRTELKLFRGYFSPLFLFYYFRQISQIFRFRCHIGESVDLCVYEVFGATNRTWKWLSGGPTNIKMNIFRRSD